uniref:Uncharacterized protein n=1 Tax=Macrostomum lignano TaxID=282301 RepID=A0A1I8FQS3_9PLAT
MLNGNWQGAALFEVADPQLAAANFHSVSDCICGGGAGETLLDREVSDGPDIRVTSPCLSNEERVYFPDEVSRLPELAKPIKSRDGPMPNAHLSLDRVAVPDSTAEAATCAANRSEAAAAIRRVCCDAMKQLTAQPSWPRNRHSNQTDRERADQQWAIPDNRNRDEAVTPILSTIVSTSAVPANNRTDSGVYEDPQEPPAVTPARWGAALAARRAAAAVQIRARH